MTAIAKLTWYDKKIVDDDTDAKILSLFLVNDDQAFTERDVAERLNLDISEIYRIKLGDRL